MCRLLVDDSLDQWRPFHTIRLVQGALFDQIRRKLWGGPVHRAMQDRVAIAILGLHVKDH